MSFLSYFLLKDQYVKFEYSLIYEWMMYSFDSCVLIAKKDSTGRNAWQIRRYQCRRSGDERVCNN